MAYRIFTLSPALSPQGRGGYRKEYMTPVPQKIDVLAYNDYREFLRDWYNHSKKTRPHFSFRNFARRAGLKSPNFLKLVMEGDRNLSTEGLEKFLIGLQINKSEAEYFTYLVQLNQATTHEDKIKSYKGLVKSRKFSRIKPIEKDQYEYYSTWYHPVIREIILHSKFDGSPAWLANKIGHGLTEAQARKSLELLERLEFIKKYGENKWQHASPVVTTGNESSSLTLLEFHQKLLQLSADSLPMIEPMDRDLSSLTIGIKKSRVSELKTAIQNFRAQVIKNFSTDEPPEDVYFLNIQMFPVTQFDHEPKNKK